MGCTRCPAPVALPSLITERTVLPEGTVIGDPAPQDIKKRGRPKGSRKSVMAKVGPRLKSGLELRASAKPSKAPKRPKL